MKVCKSFTGHNLRNPYTAPESTLMIGHEGGSVKDVSFARRGRQRHSHLDYAADFAYHDGGNTEMRQREQTAEDGGS
jgi:hypothetical protein